MNILIITYISLGIIAIVFIWLLLNASRVRKCGKIVETATVTEDSLAALDSTKLASVKASYAKTIILKIGNSDKSNIPAEEYFSEFCVCKASGINTRIIDAGSGTLVGLGLLGTFLGLTLGIQGFDSSNTANIQSSIQVLLNGMGTAFSTSLLGMGASLVYTFAEKAWRNGLALKLYDFNEKLNEKYYIDDMTLADYNRTKMIGRLESYIKKELSYTNSDGNEVAVSNAVREILINNEEQTKALKSFSTDLALELNNSFDETLSRQMQQKILPLMESVDATTKSVVEHIDRMAAQVSSPAADMIGQVVSELKTTLMSMIDEFKASISANATQELENLAMSLGSATQAMGNFPKDMEHISATLKVTIDEVKNAIAEITDNSTASNETAMTKMQEQMVFVTASISETIAEVKNVMSDITIASETASTKLAENMARSSDEIGGKTETLLLTFNGLIDRLNQTSSSINGTMTSFQQAQGEITSTTAHLSNISGDMKTATELFSKSQTDFSLKLESLEISSKRKMDELLDLMKAAGNTTDEYAEKFEIISKGLSEIFTQIQTGLNNYSTTVKTSIQGYLDEYTKNLTETTSALASTIQQQNEMVELLVDTVNRKQ